MSRNSDSHLSDLPSVDSAAVGVDSSDEHKVHNVIYSKNLAAGIESPTFCNLDEVFKAAKLPGRVPTIASVCGDTGSLSEEVQYDRGSERWAAKVKVQTVRGAAVWRRCSVRLRCEGGDFVTTESLSRLGIDCNRFMTDVLSFRVSVRNFTIPEPMLAEQMPATMQFAKEWFGQMDGVVISSYGLLMAQNLTLQFRTEDARNVMLVIIFAVGRPLRCGWG